jgi:flagellar biogenesis protein FliO
VYTSDVMMTMIMMMLTLLLLVMMVVVVVMRLCLVCHARRGIADTFTSTQTVVT